MSEDPRRAVQHLALTLARRREVVDFARFLVKGQADRVSRISAVFSFVSHLVDAPGRAGGEPVDGVDLLLALAGEREGPSVILAALLLSLGERASIRCAGGLAFVGVELAFRDVARLPPHAALLTGYGRYTLPLDARWARSPLGFLPLQVREALARRV